MFAVGIGADPLSLAPLQYRWFEDGQRNPAGRDLVDPRLVDGVSTAVMVVAGQSNAANWGTGSYTILNPDAVHNLSIYDGSVREAVEPLLGANGSKQGFLVRLADLLIETGRYDRVILAPIGVGGASVAEWSIGGPLNHRIAVTARRLSFQYLTATHVLWHQGETDCSLGTSSGDYLFYLQGVIQTFRESGITCPFYVAQASWTNGAVSQKVYRAQVAAINPSLGIYPGPNTDQLGFGYRDPEGTHFNDDGLTEHAELWRAAIDAVELA